jgi:hypothetical protein
MTNLKIHYKIDNFELTTDSNFKGSNFIFKMTTPNVPFDLPDGNLGINTDYKVWQSEQDMIDGISPFKLRNADGRVVNFPNYSLEPWGNDFSTANFTLVQSQIIADYFGVPLEKIIVVQDTNQ